MKNSLILMILGSGLVLSGCNQGNERLAEKARIEGAESAREELKAQLEAKDTLVEKARVEGKAQAEAELQVQITNKDKLIEKARAEGRAQAEEQLQTQNENLERRSKEMEQDLATRHRFYQTVTGTYEGRLQIANGEMNIRFTLVPSLPPYPAGRVRSLEEITSDLIGLNFNVQVVQWRDGDTSSSSSDGCIIEGVKPDIVKGEILLSCEKYGIFYSLYLSTPTQVGVAKTKIQIRDESKRLAKQVTRAAGGSVSTLVGEHRPATQSNINKFQVTRVVEQ